MTEPSDIARLADAREHVLERIAGACARVGRDPASVALVAVSKTVPPPRLRAAVAAGLTVLGENRVQEAEAKIGEVPGATWHLVGPLQSNKAARALAAFAEIDSVDSVDLA
ncbi:MAG TPA: YggS family pyridoxal phosphate-dependent enzyme, partial [Candidatus Limnocylindrales bacterium]